MTLQLFEDDAAKPSKAIWSRDMFLYTIDQHPETMAFVIRKYEIIGETTRHFDIQPRNTKNPLAEQNTIRISKAQNCYYESPQDAIYAYTLRQRMSIAKANKTIKLAQENIDKIEEDLGGDYE